MAADTTGSQPRTVDKVKRLLDLLDKLGRHPALNPKLLFGDYDDIARSAGQSPAALWKLSNLKKRAGRD